MTQIVVKIHKSSARIIPYIKERKILFLFVNPFSLHTRNSQEKINGPKTRSNSRKSLIITGLNDSNSSTNSLIGREDYCLCQCKENSFFIY